MVLFAGLMSLSRGGMAALFIAALVSAALCCPASAAAGRFLGIMLAACLVIGAALAIFGLDNVGRRLETLTHGANERNEWSGGRISLWTCAANGNPRLLLARGRRGQFQRGLSDIFRRCPERLH